MIDYSLVNESAIVAFSLFAEHKKAENEKPEAEWEPISVTELMEQPTIERSKRFAHSLERGL